MVAYFFHPHNAKVISVSFEPSSAKAVLLSNDTELSVAPKTRRQWNSEKNIVNGENPVTKSDPAMTSPTARTPSYTVLLRVLPASMFSDHLPSLPDFGSVIFVSQRMLSVARLEGLLPSDPKTTLIADVKRLGPPTDPAGAANPSPSDAAPIAKVLNPSEATKREDAYGRAIKGWPREGRWDGWRARGSNDYCWRRRWSGRLGCGPASSRLSKTECQPGLMTVCAG